MATSYVPPSWVKRDSDAYKRWLNRKANSLMKRDRQRGGTYRVKEAMDAIHEAMYRSDGIDPYDGQAMDSQLLGLYDNAQSQERGAAYRRKFYRLPTVDHRNAEPVCDFQIISWQTNDAKSDMSPEEYLAHCTAVVVYHRLQSTSGYPSAK